MGALPGLLKAQNGYFWPGQCQPAGRLDRIARQHIGARGADHDCGCGGLAVAGAAGSEDLEEGPTMTMDFEKLAKVAGTASSVVPCCVQHADTLEVLIIAYVNEEALAKSIETNIATFWSTSRNELWVKGLTGYGRSSD